MIMQNLPSVLSVPYPTLHCSLGFSFGSTGADAGNVEGETGPKPLLEGNTSPAGFCINMDMSKRIS